MSVNSKMTALANEIRELSGTSEAMGLDAMTNHVGEANTDVATEANLIEQIASALEGKAAVSGEDVTDETAAYTQKLEELETVIVALEAELEGKSVVNGGFTDSSGFCMVNIKTDMIVEDAIVVYYGENGWCNAELTVNNSSLKVACGSILVVFAYGYYKTIISHDGIIAENHHGGFIYQVPNTPELSVSINVIID